MAYSHYRSHAPGWGTQQFQLGAPPLPNYQPQSTWTGQDFYSAHAGGDPSLYQNTITRNSSGMGSVGKHEAKVLHRRAYAGLGEITHMLPQEIGGAAAYEAYRQVKYGSSMYQFLHGDYERQREALRGLAIAEVVRLWQDTGRGIDQYGLQVACDAAAATAYHIVSQRESEESQGMGVGYGAGSYRDRRNSFSAFPPSYASSGGYGTGSGFGGTSTLGGGSPLMPASQMGMGASPIPVPGSPYAHMSMGVPYVSSVGSVGGGVPTSYGGGGYGYAGSYGSYGTPGYDVGGLQAANAYHLGGYASLPGSPQTIIIPPPEGRRHRSSRRHHRRHHSHDRYS